MRHGAWSRLLAPLALLAGACLVQRPDPDLPVPAPRHETRRTTHPGGQTRRETTFVIRPDGRPERDGPEREFDPAGNLLEERAFTDGEPSGRWRTWFPDGTPRSEVDFGPPGDREVRPCRFWHPNGVLAAEGAMVAGAREGTWTYRDADGRVLREGPYRAGVREGVWTFYRRDGSRRAEGRYRAGLRVGEWTLWDETGTPHTRSAAAVEALLGESDGREVPLPQ